MKVSLEVADADEGRRVIKALEDHQVRAFVNVFGALAELHPASRASVIQAASYLLDARQARLEAEQQTKPGETLAERRRRAGLRPLEAGLAEKHDRPGK